MSYTSELQALRSEIAGLRSRIDEIDRNTIGHLDRILDNQAKIGTDTTPPPVQPGPGTPPPTTGQHDRAWYDAQPNAWYEDQFNKQDQATRNRLQAEGLRRSGNSSFSFVIAAMIDGFLNGTLVEK